MSSVARVNKFNVAWHFEAFVQHVHLMCTGLNFDDIREAWEKISLSVCVELGGAEIGSKFGQTPKIW